MLVIPDRRLLVLDTTAAADIAAAIPHAKHVPHDGKILSAIPYGTDEALVLRNLGLDVPPPILHYYNWPGRFAPMDHQKETAAFITTHRRALVLNAPGCVDADTEYLSPTGWVRIADYVSGPVAQFVPETGELQFVEGKYVKLPCDEMVRVKTKYGVDQLLSPEHRCLVYSKRNPAKYEVLRADELHRREREPIRKSHETVAFSQSAIRTTFSYGGQGIALTDAQLRVQVAVIADGHFPAVSGHRCIVRVKKHRKQQRMRELLDAAGIAYVERPVAPEGFIAFTFYAPWRTKVFDARWWASSAHQLRLVYDEVQHWDSCVSTTPTRGWRFSSYVRESADFVQFACAATGNTARVLVARRQRRGRTEVEYCVQVRPGVTMVGLQGGSSGEATSKSAPPDGFKYCFMVPSTFLVLRRNGCVFTTGNTGKSLSALWAADFLLTEGAIKRVLIVCPLSTVKVVWGSELKHHFPHRSFVLCVGTRQKRMELLARPGVQYVVINHDGFTTMAEHLTDFDVVIYDEATALKTPGSARYRVFSKWVAKYQPWLWLMTGTPISQTPADAWTLARLANSPVVPKSFTTFKDQVMQKVSQFRWVPRPDALETCRKVLQPSIRFSLDECKDLPQTNYVGRKTQLTAQQAKAFKEMQTKAVTTFAQGQVTAANAAVLLGKLLQICCIAEDTPVLTARGWVPIQQITTEDKLWDGEEWVNCSGSVCNGYKPVVPCDGVSMTLDHQVLTRGGWRTAEEILHGDASEGLERASVRLPNSDTPSWVESIEQGNVDVQVRVWERGYSGEPVPARQASPGAPQLRVPPRQPDTQNVAYAPLQNMDEHAPQVHGPEEQGLEKLRGAWNHGVRGVAGVVRRVLGGHGRGLLPTADPRQKGQQRGVLAGQLSVGDPAHAGEQSPWERAHTDADGGVDRSGGGEGVWAAAADDLPTTSEGKQGLVAPRVARVYDVLNCGPRSRFVVRGEDGQLLIVHNCGIVYGDAASIAVDASERYNTLTELIDEIGDKVIIFVPLRGVQDWLMTELVKSGYDVATVHGDVSKKDRDTIFENFQRTDTPRVLLAHPKVAAHGLTLTRAKDIIWYAPIYSLEQYEQANARIRRLTSTGRTSVWHIWATTFEAELYRRLRAKQTTLAEFLQLVRGINED